MKRCFLKIFAFSGTVCTFAARSFKNLGASVNTTMLLMHIYEAKSANVMGDTHEAMNHIILALEEIEMILSGNSTTTASAGNATSTHGTLTSNSTYGGSPGLME
jgi:hypothetical protein